MSRVVTIPSTTEAPDVVVEFSGELDLSALGRCTPPAVTSWFVTFGYGRAAGGTYTEFRVPLVENGDGAPLPDEQQQRIGRLVVRELTVELYGTAWAFDYAPAEYATAIAPYEMKRREIVDVDVRVLS